MEPVEEPKPVVEEPKVEEPKVEEPVKGSENLSAKEFNDLKSKIGVLEAKLRFKEVEEQVQGYTFTEGNPTGKLLPKSSEVAKKLLMSLSERQSKLFTEFMESLPKVSKVLFTELGGDDGKSLEASEELIKKSDELFAKGGAKTFGQALKKVSADNPQLVEKR